MTIPLAALIRRVSRMAEQMFDKQGDIDPIWLVENASGEQHMIVSPIYAESPLEAADKKDRIAAKMREYFTEHGIVRYVRAVEGWTLEGSSLGAADDTDEQRALRYAAMGYTFAKHPARREVVQIHGEDDTEALWALRDIIRPANGKPYLGKLGPIERYEQVTSRWSGLLPSKEHAAALRERPPEEPPKRVRFVRELGGHFGRTFATAVPNAPIQLVGSRDPKTGELCVGAIVGPPKDGDQRSIPDWSDVPEIEVVTGPEAELLILSMHGWLTEQAEAEGLTFEEYVAKLAKKSAETQP
jgi:hypothetical protein